MRPAWGFPGSVLVRAAVSAPIMIWMWRMAANALERALLGWSAKVRKILIVGQLAEEDVGRLRASHRPPYEIAGHLGKDAYGDQTIPHLGEVADLERVMSELEVDEVFLVAPDLEREEMLDAIAVCHGYRVRIRLVLGIYETLLSAAQTRFRDETPLYSFRQTGITGWTLVIKRLIDVTTASILLLITGILFVLPACVAIVIDSKGWPVFSQTRVGIRGRRFKLYKLRTMVIDADAKGGPLTADNDPRITKVGNFLRKSSIDELPQLWNVIVGDMSMVGPRAVVPYVADQFQEWERVSLAVKPGVTGLAQVSGRDEIAFREKSLLNLYYVRNHSIWLDLRIVFDTIGVVLSMEGTGGTRGAEKKRK
jgi:exopolysaccharide biosynthesis polyprenyl glycosylphosphotransferase